MFLLQSGVDETKQRQIALAYPTRAAMAQRYKKEGYLTFLHVCLCLNDAHDD
jgi:hypothetical protein